MTKLISKAKLLKGSDLAGYIKERQAKQVRSLKQSKKIHPKLVILRSSTNPVIETYVRLKQQYGADIGVEVSDVLTENGQLIEQIKAFNADGSVHGIIVQLPLLDDEDPSIYLDAVAPEKDVDALGQNPQMTPATPMAIQWLLAGLNVQMKDKKITIVGNGRLVGAPLFAIFSNAGQDVQVIDEDTPDSSAVLLESDIVISATGQPRLITSEKIKQGAVVIDAGTTAEKGSIAGDAHPDLYGRADLKITPPTGGIGPLTVCALFDNVLFSALAKAHSD